jgi:hypothetical protein
VRWFWTINGVHAGPNVMSRVDYAPTFKQVMAEFKENGEKWLAWAKLRPRLSPPWVEGAA